MKDKNSLRREILEKVKEFYETDLVDKKIFNPGKDLAHYAGRVHDADELVTLVDSSLDFWLTAGRFTEEFETGLAEFLRTGNVLTVNSGSSANLVALSTLTSPTLLDRRIRPGDEVITVAASFPTTVNAIIQNRAVPVFVDVELGTYNTTVEKIDAAIGPSTKAVMMAHSMGVPFELREIKDLCDRNGLWLVEDNCDALGALYDGHYTGTVGDLCNRQFLSGPPDHHGRGRCYNHQR